MTEDERNKAVGELRARRVARGLADPLNRLREIVNRAIENGSQVAIERREE